MCKNFRLNIASGTKSSQKHMLRFKCRGKAEAKTMPLPVMCCTSRDLFLEVWPESELVDSFFFKKNSPWETQIKRGKSFSVWQNKPHRQHLMLGTYNDKLCKHDSKYRNGN